MSLPVIETGSSRRPPASAGARRWPRHALAAGLSCWLPWSSAAAREPRSLTEPDVLEQPAAVVDVVDAFGERGGIDLRVSLGYRQTWRRATIQREALASTPTAEPLGGIRRHDVLRYSENVSRLLVRSDLGLYRDLALVIRVPVVLSDERSLESIAGGPPGILDAAPGRALVALPFRSPNRSGVEYLGLGIDWGILSQNRDPDRPNLVIGVEGRLSVSEPMHACSQGAPVACAHPGDVNRDGFSGEFPFETAAGEVETIEASFSGTRRPGVGRGTTGLHLHAAASRRYGLIEPYAGFDVLFESDNDKSDFGGESFWNDGPPTRSSVSLGAEIMPWEVVEQFQRFSLDLRLEGSFATSGRDYSPLFDALGSSAAWSYRLPRFSDYHSNPDPATSGQFPSVVDPLSRRVYPTGITQVQAHGKGVLSLTAKWQAGRYVRFHLGGSLALTQPHFINRASPCDLDRRVPVERAGPCAPGDAATDAAPRPDPSFRPEIDLPGRRFLVDAESAVDAWMSATVMF